MKFIHHVVFMIVCVLASSTLLAQSYEEIIRAVEKGDGNALSALLDRGLDPNTTDKSGHSLLMLASRLGNPEMVSRLLQRKADPKRRSPAGDSALMMAALRGSPEIVRMLVAAGGELNHSGWTPLQYAAFSGHGATVRLLLDLGADKDAVAPNGYSALMLATRNGHVGAVRELLFSDPDLNFRSVDGLTALKLAIQLEKKEVEALLRRAGGIE